METPEGRFKERGPLFTKSNNKDMNHSFLVPLSHISRCQHKISQVGFTSSTWFLSQTFQISMETLLDE